MAGIAYVEGDATAPQGSGPRVIAHICNDIGGWGAGFVRAISRRWRAPEADFRTWYRGRAQNDYALGAVRLVRVEDGLWVANLIGQHGIGSGPDGPPVRYPAIGTALAALGDRCLELNASVHMPRIGCGLAGGTWDRVEPLIDEHLTGRGVGVTVYDLPSGRTR